MRILILHCHYGAGAVGGEMQVVRNESELLRSHGNDVLNYERNNQEFFRLPLMQRLRRLSQLDWSRDAQRELESVLDDFRPDVMHVHNYKFMFTPAVFEVAKARGIRTVLTLHNYRLMVPCGNFMDRNKMVCDRCLDGRYQRYLWENCTGASWPKRFMQYMSFRGGLREHRLVGVVDAFIVLSEFYRRMLLDAGIPEEQLFLKPNFMADPKPDLTSAALRERQGAIFIGRISEEKGVEPLLQAWGDSPWPLTIVGDGPLKKTLVGRYRNPLVKWLGQLPYGEGQALLKKSRFMVFPSTLYEGFPLSVMEAKAHGVPVIASDLGPRREVIENRRDGMLYECSDPGSLRKALVDFHQLPFGDYQRMCESAYDSYLQTSTPEVNYNRLIAIYAR